MAAAFIVVACAMPGTQQAGEFDRQFIDMMVPHHQSATEMAKLAITRSTRPEIKTLGAEIIKAQEGEIAQMKAWRKEWFGSDQTPSMDRMPMLPGMAGMEQGGGATMDMTKDTEMLRMAEPFDRQFIDMMREHHKTAIDAGRLAQTKGQRKEIRELGTKIIADQQREIDRMTEWRRAWYGST